MQEKKKAEADKQKELNDLFAIAIKQPKVPPGEDRFGCQLLWQCLAVSALLMLAKPYLTKHPSLEVPIMVAQYSDTCCWCRAALQLALGMSGHRDCRLELKEVQSRESFSWMPVCSRCSCGCLQVSTPNR